jgi:hypothetical protein
VSQPESPRATRHVRARRGAVDLPAVAELKIIMFLCPTPACCLIMPSYTSGELITIFECSELIIFNICMFSFEI